MDADSLFEKYYSDYYNYIIKFCTVKLSDRPDMAEDCVQETFKVLYEKLSRSENIKYPKAFLLKTANNFVNLKYREIKKEKTKHIPIHEIKKDVGYEQKFLKIHRKKSSQKLKMKYYPN